MQSVIILNAVMLSVVAPLKIYQLVVMPIIFSIITLSIMTINADAECH